MRVRLQKAEDALEDSASALTNRDAFWKEELQQAQQDRQSYQAQVLVCAILFEKNPTVNELEYAYDSYESARKGRLC